MSALARLLPLLFLAACVNPTLVLAQNSLEPAGQEYPLFGPWPGDQMHARLALGANGGYIVWQDNATDEQGLGISARKITGTLSAGHSSFRVNGQGRLDQEKPAVALLSNGGAAFVWQSGQVGFQVIKARFMNGMGVFVTSDVSVNSAGSSELNPQVAGLAQGGAVVVWASRGRDGSMQGVFGQRFSNEGSRVGEEFQVNQFSLYNQRTPALVALPDGGFLVAWVSENQRFEGSVDIYARRYNSTGEAAGDEFIISDGQVPCANPVLAVGGQGILAGWSRLLGAQSKWDVVVRKLDMAGQPVGSSHQLNQSTEGSQSAPQLAYSGGQFLVVWTSYGQDGSQEGVVGRRAAENGQPIGDEFLVNSTMLSSQLAPAVASAGSGRFLSVWSSFGGGITSFDLLAQRFQLDHAQVLPQPQAPFVSALDQTSIAISWPGLSGFGSVAYEVFVDGASVPVEVDGNYARVEEPSWAPGSSHSVRLGYRLANGERSPLSEVTTVVTWGADANGDGLPDDWQTWNWGRPENWPAADADVDGDGASNLAEFLAGTDPMNGESVLRTYITREDLGKRLHWNVEAGSVYQVEQSDNLHDWTPASELRFATENTDSILITEESNSSYFRIIKLR